MRLILRLSGGAVDHGQSGPCHQPHQMSEGHGGATSSLGKLNGERIELSSTAKQRTRDEQSRRENSHNNGKVERSDV